MAKVLAAKLKRIEDTATEKESQFRQVFQRVESELHQTKGLLDIRCKEVQMLKHAILAERKRNKEFINDRDAEMADVFAKQQATLASNRELMSKAQTHIQRLNERIEELNTERAKITASLEKLQLKLDEFQRGTASLDSLRLDREEYLRDRERWSSDKQRLRNQIYELEAAKQTIISEWEVKYKIAKKTAANYKVSALLKTSC